MLTTSTPQARTAHPRSTPVFVTQYGGVWRLSARNFKRLQSLIASGAPYDLDTLGKSITTDLIDVHDLCHSAADARDDD